MAKDWLKIKLPKVVHTCCGYTYNSKKSDNAEYFRCFAHKSPKKKINDDNGNLIEVKFCITLWLVCKNNECITSFTHYYDNKNNMITKTRIGGLKYLLSLKDKFLENIPLKVKTVKIEPKSKKYLWRYTDKHPTKSCVSNIYNLDDKKVGETLPQKIKIYYS